MTRAQHIAGFWALTIESAREAVRCYFEPIAAVYAWLKNARQMLLHREQDPSKKMKVHP